MNKACVKWRDQLLETALGEIAGNELEAHLSRCSDCAAELIRLRARRERVDMLLPMIAGAEEPLPDLPDRIKTAARATSPRERGFLWQRWAIAGGTAVTIIAVMIGWVLKPNREPLDATPPGVVALAHWQAPTDALLQIPGHEFLNAVPKLGESYLTISTHTQTGEK